MLLKLATHSVTSEEAEWVAHVPMKTYCAAVGEVLEWAVRSRSWEMVVEGEERLRTNGRTLPVFIGLEGAS